MCARAFLEVDEVTYSYRDKAGTSRALDRVSLRVDEGEFVCLIGHSGCGKSTLLSVLAGLNTPDSGRVTMGGSPLEGPGTTRAVVFQHYSLFPWMTALKNVSFSMRKAQKGLRKREAIERASAYLDQVGILKEAGRYPFQLSGGMQQRVAIARALAMESDVLLLDEPFGALDAKSRRELQNLLIRLWQEAGANGRRRTVVFVTHDIDEALVLADRILFMRPGRIERDIPVDMPRPREACCGKKCAAFLSLESAIRSLFYLDESGGGEQDGC